jgi:hypothetical protein
LIEIFEYPRHYPRLTLFASLIPPFFILKAKHHDKAWYHNNPPDWRIGVSKNS